MLIVEGLDIPRHGLGRDVREELEFPVGPGGELGLSETQQVVEFPDAAGALNDGSELGHELPDAELVRGPLLPCEHEAVGNLAP